MTVGFVPQPTAIHGGTTPWFSLINGSLPNRPRILPLTKHYRFDRIDLIQSSHACLSLLVGVKTQTTLHVLSKLSSILIDTVLFCVSLVIGYYWRVPSELKKVMRLLSDEWKLVSWNHQSMGWLGKFVVRGRIFYVSSHRGDIEVYELADDGRQIEIHPPESQRDKKSPEQVYALLTKTVD